MAITLGELRRGMGFGVGVGVEGGGSLAPVEKEESRNRIVLLSPWLALSSETAHLCHRSCSVRPPVEMYMLMTFCYSCK